MKKSDLFKPDTHRNRRDHELLGKRAGEVLKHLIVTSLVERSDHCPDLFVNVAWHHDPILSPKHAGIVVAESIAPGLQNQLARHQETRSVEVNLHRSLA
jgi:hypothetical protein